MSARFTLRDATAEAHESLDTMMGSLDLSNAADYARFLRIQAAALLPYETALDHAGAAQILADWPAHRRGASLLEDLDALGIPLPKPVAIPSVVGEPDVLGALYVLEGSRLGGKLLEREVPDGMPKAFLRHEPPLAWREFVALLEQRLASPVDRAVAVQAATKTFDAFSTAAREYLGTQ